MKNYILTLFEILKYYHQIDYQSVKIKGYLLYVLGIFILNNDTVLLKLNN